MPLEKSKQSSAPSRRELLLGDALRRIPVAAILLALYPVLEVIVQLLGIGECVGRRLHDRRGQGVAEFGPRFAAMNRQGAKAERLAGWVLTGKVLSHLNSPVVVRVTSFAFFAAILLIAQLSNKRTRST
jgi:hypothetical protein